MFHYVINLDRRKDKYEEFSFRIKSRLIDDTFIRISAFDGFNLFKDEVVRCGLMDHPLVRYIEKKGLVFKQGELGCFLSHLMTLDAITKNDLIGDDVYVQIFEDDAMCGENFDENYAKLRKDLEIFQGDFMYTGGRFSTQFNNDMKHNAPFFKNMYTPNTFQRLQKSPICYLWDRTTHAYLVQKKKCKLIIDLLLTHFVKESTNVLLPIDQVYSGLCRKIKMFDYKPHIFYSPMNYKSDIQYPQR